MAVTLTPITTTVTITVGTNSYVSLANAETYIATIYGVAATWDALSDDDKSRALISATRAIDGLRLAGYKSIDTQPLAFPRVLETPYWTSYHDHLEHQEDVPQAVIDATCYEAVALATTDRNALRSDGVSEFQIGSLKEKLSGGRQPLRSREALRLLKPYLLRSVPVR